MRVRIKARKPRLGKIANSRHWIAIGTLAAYTASGPQPIVAQSTAGRPKRSAAVQSLPIIQFNIPAGTLGSAIAAFEIATGWRVELPAQGAADVESIALSGPMPAPQALRQLLAGSGFTFRQAGPRRAIVEFEKIRTTVDVTDHVPLSSPRYTEPLRDLPQTIAVIPKEVITQQGATSLTEVLRNVPGLTITAGEGGTPSGDNLTLRGNSARNDIFLDGVRDLNPQSRDPFNLEQVEVTKGPSSAVSGRGSAGGSINLISKAPSLDRLVNGSLALGNAGMRRATMDLNAGLRRIGLGERTAFRLNLLSHESGVAGRNAVSNGRWGVAPSLAFGLGTPTRLTASYYKLKQDNVSDYGIPWVPATNNALSAYRDRPAPVPRETFYGLRQRDHEFLNQDAATAKLDHDFNDNATLRTQVRFGTAKRNSVATAPRFASLDSTAINREMRAWAAEDRIVDNQTDLTARWKTRGIRHALVTGAAFTNERNVRVLRSAPNSLTSLLNPNPDDAYTGPFTANPNKGRISGNTQSAWLFDTAKFGEHWEATGGVRWERFRVNGISTAPAAVAQIVHMTSVRAGLIHKPVQAGTLYASYGSSLSPSLEGLSYNTANTAIPPEKTWTAETGAKWEFAGGRLLVAGALFRNAKDNARTPGLLPDDPPQVLAGRQVSQGLEFSASGSVTRFVRVLGAYTFLDARIRNSNTPAEAGRFFQNTPRNSASVWITFTARRFTAGLGPRFAGRRFGNNINTRQVPGYGTLDVMASYRVNSRLDLRLNLSNLNDAFYYERLGGGHIVPGPSRFGTLTANFRF